MTHLLTPLSILGIGSVPFVEGQEIIGPIFENYDIPFWPQYPQRSPKENFVFQFLSVLPGLEMKGSSFRFDEEKYCNQSKALQDRLSRVFEEENFSEFEPPVSSALGYSQLKDLLKENRFPEKRVIKLQITGPNTVWKSFFSQIASVGNGKQVFKDICQILTASGLAQIQRISNNGRTPLIFIDEPLLSGGDSEELMRMVETFRTFGALVGLHVCSSLDWRSLEHLEIHIFHFDFTATRHSLTSHHKSFLRDLIRKGTWVAWGVVPTGPNFEFKLNDFTSILLDWLVQFAGETAPLNKVLQHLLLAPACGTGTLSPAQDRMTLQTLLAAAEAFRSKGLRLKKSLDSIRGEGILFSTARVTQPVGKSNTPSGIKGFKSNRRKY